MGTEETRTLARGYFDAWTSGGGNDTVGAFLADAFVFSAGPMRIEGRDAFLSSGAWPDSAVTVMVAEAYDGDRAFQFYEATNGDKKVRIIEHLTVADGKIATSEVVSDSAAFGAFMAG